ncbi:MAG TPA: hypothetical protein VFI95_16975 [Terriglobales bacterium]|nr:hypothetical protein [Terriglobales bacterium]
MRVWTATACVAFLLLVVPALPGQELSVSGRVNVSDAASHRQSADGVVVWLVPADGEAPAHVTDDPEKHPSLTQKNKRFDPHVLAVQVGTVVDFPNHDPFFHNVFSLFDGKRFDLGLYEAGSTRHVRFDRPGISYIFCNIHPEMSAVVVVVDTPYFATTGDQGDVLLPKVPAGAYTVHVWDERANPEALARLRRQVVLSPSASSLGTVSITENRTALAHKNKYGREYDTPAPSSTIYIQP